MSSKREQAFESRILLLFVLSLITLSPHQSAPITCGQVVNVTLHKELMDGKSGCGIVSSEQETRLVIRYFRRNCSHSFLIRAIFSSRLKYSNDSGFRFTGANLSCRFDKSHSVKTRGSSTNRLDAWYKGYSISIDVETDFLRIRSSYGLDQFAVNRVPLRHQEIKNMNSMVILTPLREFSVTEVPVLQLLMSDGLFAYLYTFNLRESFSSPGDEYVSSDPLLTYAGYKYSLEKALETHLLNRESEDEEVRREEEGARTSTTIPSARLPSIPSPTTTTTLVVRRGEETDPSLDPTSDSRSVAATEAETVSSTIIFISERNKGETTMMEVVIPPGSSSHPTLNMTGPQPYFGDFFYLVFVTYKPIHGFLSLFVCIFGIFANILNIVVLTRKEMLSPTNAILTGLASADLMVMIEYVPFVIHTSIENYPSTSAQNSYPWAVFTLFHTHFSVIFHSISSWLTVILAVWRYTSVSFPTESKIWCSMNNAKITIGLTYIIVPILCIPQYLAFSIITVQNVESDPPNEEYLVNFSDISLKNDALLKNINFWVFSVGLKLVPCILLTYLSLALIRVLLAAERRRQRLKSNVGLTTGSHVSVASGETAAASALSKPVHTGHHSHDLSLHERKQKEEEMDDRRGSNRSETSFVMGTAASIDAVRSERRMESSSSALNPGKQDDRTPSQTPSCSLAVSSHSSTHQQTHIHRQQHAQVITASSTQSDRTTKMLLAILLIYLICEMPNGIVTLLVGLLDEEFEKQVYGPLGEIFDIMALINSGINFILLTTMSRLFRKTFCKIFLPRKYHNHYQTRDHPRMTEKSNINHVIIRSETPNPNQSGNTTSGFNSRQSHNKNIELNNIRSHQVDQVAAVITITEPSQHQEPDEETTMV